MKKIGRILISLYSIHQGARFAKIVALILLFSFASWRAVDGAHDLLERRESGLTVDAADLLTADDPLAHLQALLLSKSHCQVNQGADLAKITWLFSSSELEDCEPLYLKKGVATQVRGVSIEFGGFSAGFNAKARIFLKTSQKTLELSLPIESAPLVPLSEQQLRALSIRYLGMNLFPPEESAKMQPPELSSLSSEAMPEAMSKVESAGVLENSKEECFYFISSQNPPPLTLFHPLFPRSMISSTSFTSDKAIFDVFDEKGFLMKIELPKVKDFLFARDHFKQIQLERVTFGAALVNFKQVKTPIKMGRAYLLNEKGCFDLTDHSLKELYMNGELIGQLVVYQGMTLNGTKKEAKFEVIDSSRTCEEERVLVYEAKRTNAQRPSRSSTKQANKARPGHPSAQSSSPEKYGRGKKNQESGSRAISQYSIRNCIDPVKYFAEIVMIFSEIKLIFNSGWAR